MITLDAPTESPPPVFEEALRWFRGRVPMTDAAFAALSVEAQRRAFTLAGVAALTVVSDVWRSLDATLAAGRTLRDFKRDVAPALLGEWQGSVAAPAWRMEVIFRNATQRAYVHGRVEQLRDPEVAPLRPFWMFDAVGDARTSAICTALDGTVLAASDPWWTSHTPPCHHACRSTIRGLRANDPRVVAAGPAPDTEAQAGFGVLPEADDWIPREGDYPADVWAAYLSNPQAYRVPMSQARESSALRSAETRIAGRSREIGYIFSRDGRLLSEITQQGETTELFLTEEERARAAGAIFTHNHPRNSSFSAGDFYESSALDVHQMRAVVIREGRIKAHSLTRPSGGWPPVARLRDAYQEADVYALEAVREMEDRGRVFAKGEARIIASEIRARRMAELTGIEYSTEDIGEFVADPAAS